MFHVVRPMVIALTLGLLLAGCSGNHRPRSRADRGTALPASTTRQDASRSESRSSSRGNAKPASRPDELLGYIAPSEPRYHITLDEIREHVQNNTAVFIDARSPSDFALGHIRGALNMPPSQLDAYMAQISRIVSVELTASMRRRDEAA